MPKPPGFGLRLRRAVARLGGTSLGQRGGWPGVAGGRGGDRDHESAPERGRTETERDGDGDTIGARAPHPCVG